MGLWEVLRGARTLSLVLVMLRTGRLVARACYGILIGPSVSHSPRFPRDLCSF